MEELLCVILAADGDISVTSDFDFSIKDRTEKDTPFYRNLVETLSRSDSACLQAIRLLESARRDARKLSTGLHPELEKALILWRREKAGELRVPPYYILHQRTLLNIADLAPANREELLAVPGFGPGFYARYGEEILTLIQQLVPNEHENAGNGAPDPEKQPEEHENVPHGAPTAENRPEEHENTGIGACEEPAP